MSHPAYTVRHLDFMADFDVMPVIEALHYSKLQSLHPLFCVCQKEFLTPSSAFVMRESATKRELAPPNDRAATAGSIRSQTV